MASDLKEMKYRRRIGAPVVDEPGQCSDQRGVDWAMLKQDPVELLRKLDELRDQITRSCEIIGQPRERRRVSRRALSMLPEYPELPLPPPAALGHGPGYYRSRYAGRCEPGLPPSYPLRPGHGERYVRRSNGRYRQLPARQWDNCGSGHGNYRQNVCLCAHCLHGQRTVAPEEHIPMARYFAGQHECYRFERSPSVSSDYDRRSVASSLYSNRSVSKRRAEYFRKKAEHLCRPARGAAPFIVCSSCYQLLELPPEKCMGRKQSRLQCGSCSEIISFKLEEVKVSPFVPQSSVPMSKTLQSSNDQMTRDLECEHQDDGNATLYNLQERSSVQHNIDFADDNSLSSTISHDRTDKGCGSNRSIQSKAGGLSLSPSRYGDVESPKDILCQRDADCQVVPSVGGPVSPQCPVLEDKLVDPYCSQEKDDSVVDQSTSKRCGLSSKRDYYASISMRSEQKSTEDDKDGLEDGSISEKNKQKSNKDMNERNEQKSKEDMNERNKQKSKEDTTKRDTDSLEDGSMSKKYEQKSKEDGAGSLEDGRMSTKYENKRKEDNIDSIEDGSMGEKSEQKSKEDDTGSLEDGSMIKKYEQKNKKEDADILEDGSMGKMYGYKRKEDDTGSIEDGSMGKKYEQKSKEDDMASLDDGSVSKKYKQESKQDDRDGLEAESISKTYVQNNKDDNNSLICDSASKRCDRKNTEENGQLQHPYTEDANVLVETESSVTGRTNSGFSHGSSEVGLDEDQSSTGKSGDSSFFAGFLKKGFKDLSLFNQSVDSVKVSINGHPISERALKKAEKKAGPVDPGSYWYDYRAGFWGVIGRECIGIIPPFIREFNYPMPKNCASGNTGVFVNGRELHQKDLDLLVGRGLPRISGKSYSIEISGNITDETSGKKLRSLGKLAPTIEKLKRGFGMHVPEEIS